MDWNRAWVPVVLCGIVMLMQVLLVVRLYASSRVRKPKTPPQEVIFDAGGLIFLTGIQALLVRSAFKSYRGDSWISTLIIIGMSAVVLGVLINLLNFRRKT